MPLRDHFHSPLNDERGWTGVHAFWPAKIVELLLPSLPANYFAEPRVSIGGGFEVDVGARETPLSSLTDWQNGKGSRSATATWSVAEPILRVETEVPDFDEFEVRIHDVDRGRRLVAAVEIVSPANKDRPESRQAFVSKCAALLARGVAVTIVDVVTDHDFNLYAELLAFVNQPPPDESSAIYAVSCRGSGPRLRWLLEAWGQPLRVGDMLPTLPLWLSDQLVLSLDLEASYEETCRVLRIA